MEQKGHQVYRSIADIHHAICDRVRAFDSAPTSAPAESALHTSTSGSSVEATTTAAGHGEREEAEDGRCLALLDYYPFWRESLEAAEAGKLLPVELCDNPKVRRASLSQRSPLL